MSVYLFTALVGLGSFLAGFLGALTGLGGGVVVVPMLALIFHVDIKYAIGASLVSVIATSSGAAAAYVREGYSNIRIGMFLETATTIGAIVGAYVALVVSGSSIAVVFGLVLLYSAFLSSRHREASGVVIQASPLANKLRLNGSYPTPQGIEHYNVTGVIPGYGLMFGAGVLSGLLGIGSGAVKGRIVDGLVTVTRQIKHAADQNHRSGQQHSGAQQRADDDFNAQIGPVLQAHSRPVTPLKIISKPSTTMTAAKT